MYTAFATVFLLALGVIPLLIWIYLFSRFISWINLLKNSFIIFGIPFLLISWSNNEFKYISGYYIYTFILIEEIYKIFLSRRAKSGMASLSLTGLFGPWEIIASKSQIPIYRSDEYSHVLLDNTLFIILITLIGLMMHIITSIIYSKYRNSSFFVTLLICIILHFVVNISAENYIKSEDNGSYIDYTLLIFMFFSMTAIFIVLWKTMAAPMFHAPQLPAVRPRSPTR